MPTKQVLHILRSEPDGLVRRLIAEMSRDEESEERTLFEGDTDYAALLRAIFESDRVISWW